MKQMIQKIIYLVAAITCLVVAGCSDRAGLPGDDNPGTTIDLSKTAEVTLTGINLLESEAATRAVGDKLTPLAEGTKLRMYVFPEQSGPANMDDLILTRIYTIENINGVPTPVAEGGGTLYLPIGNLSVYLVSPLEVVMNKGEVDSEGNPIPEDVREVASERGVFPSNGIDLIASCTSLEVEAGANEFQAEALRHQMARMQVVVTDDNLKVGYSDLVVNTISVTRQTNPQDGTGEFYFDSGKDQFVQPVGEGEVTISPQIVEEQRNERFVATLYVLPREAVDMTIGVYFTCKRQDTSGTTLDRRLESGTISGIAMPAGRTTRFTTNPTISDNLVFRTKLLPWTDQEMPTEVIPVGEGLQFSYNALDAPSVIDGNLYWLDRSGNGNHAQLMGDIRYDPVGHYYYANSKGAYIRIPRLVNVPEYTLEITAESGYNAPAIPILFSDDLNAPQLSMMLPATGNTLSYGNSGANFQYAFEANDKGYLNNLATYAFCRRASAISVARNAVKVGSDVNVTGQTSFGDNRLVYWNDQVGSAGMQHLRIYAARLTSKYLSPGSDALKHNYRNDMSAFARADVSTDYSAQDYIRNGLVLDLRGDKAPVSGQWEDQSGMTNHAVIHGAGYDATGKYLTFDGTNNYLKLLNSVGTMDNYTIEFVVQPEGADNSVLFHFSSQETRPNTSEFLLSFPSSAGKVWMECPYQNGRGDSYQWETEIGSFPYTSITNRVYQYSIARKHGTGLTMRQCGLLAWDNLLANTPLNEMKYCYIGRNVGNATGGSNAGVATSYFKGKLYAVRVYNRTLSEKEQQINYQVDKAKYSLLK